MSDDSALDVHMLLYAYIPMSYPLSLLISLSVSVVPLSVSSLNFLLVSPSFFDIIFLSSLDVYLCTKEQAVRFRFSVCSILPVYSLTFSVYLCLFSLCESLGSPFSIVFPFLYTVRLLKFNRVRPVYSYGL
ncbi:hypothetical protein CPC08DRAFT_165324 [Agrocybe pediades]|nr:hypothetical protein CPC08DRAFT_165324 [Agrocybe pediades]